MNAYETPLPDPDRQRARLLAAIDRIEADRSRRNRYAVPAFTTAAVLVAGTVGYVALDDAGGSTAPPTFGAAGQSESAGVARDKARPGDMVPMAVAKEALKQCLAHRDEVVKGPPPPVAPNTGNHPNGSPAPSDPLTGSPPPSLTLTASPGAPAAPVAPGQPGIGYTVTGPLTGDPGAVTPPGIPSPTGSPAPDAAAATATSLPPPPEGPRFPVLRPSPPSSTGIEGQNRRGPVTMRNLLRTPAKSPWELPGSPSSYRPFFTAWESDGSGGLTPFVVAKADGPALLMCHGARSFPDVPTPTASTAWLYEAIEADRLQVLGNTMDDEQRLPVLADTNWGRAAPAVVRVTLSYVDGTRLEAVVRDGVWFATTDASVFADAKRAGDEAPTVTAYDAAGQELYKIPDPASPECYRTTDNTLLAYRVDAPKKPNPTTCEPALAWTGTTGG